MIKNYLKIAWRNVVKNKLQTFINMAGLSVGMAVALMIGLWIYDELSFDKYNPDCDRIAQVKQNETNNGEIVTLNNLPFPLGDELRNSYGNDFKYVVMATRTDKHILSLGENNLSSSGAFFESEAPRLLHLVMVQGGENALDEPSSMLVSESLAKAFFGSPDPVNKVMRIDNKMEVKITGVYKDLPYNSSFADLSFIGNWQLLVNSTGLNTMQNPWRRNAFLVYAQIAEHADMGKVSRKIRDSKLNRVNKDEAAHKPALFLYPMAKWHLYSDFKNGVNIGGRIQYVWLFGIIGVMVLFMACINFMNLSTARSEKRAREVGVRKAMGSLRGQLIKQFFSESILVSILAFVLSLVWVQIMLPLFNEVADKRIGILWNEPVFWLICLGFSVFTGVLAGSYPALYLSSFHPTKVLKGIYKAGPAAIISRNIFVVLQFTASVILIIGTLVVYSQIQYAQSRPIGYNQQGLVVLPMSTTAIHNHFSTVKNELIRTGAITDMAESGNPTTGIHSTNGGFEWRGKDPGLSADFPTPEVTTDYGKTVGWQFIAGRDFSTSVADSSAFVVNEAAVKFMGLKNPVGEIVKQNGKPYTIIGVVKDMIVESPYEPVRPSIYNLSGDPTDYRYVYLRINPTVSMHDALSKIKPVFKSFNASQPFEYNFADTEYAKKFGAEERVGRLAGFFAFLAIFISCLGLFAMASFVAEQRIREIGIRKVLGASVFNLWKLLSVDFVVLISISLVIATPVTYYFMHQWLQHYQYHIGLQWWIFVITAAGAIIITLITVSYQGITAALANPVKSLKAEG